jgi:hypothetical protein
MRRINIFSLAMGLFAAATAFAQAPRPAGSASRVSALENAMDRKAARELLRSAKPAHPPDIDINCNLPHGPNNSINAALARLDPNRIWTLRVTGTCNENVTVQSFEDLTLIANPGASINDASGGTLDVLTVADTPEFSLQGFTINGGFDAVNCIDYSLCRFSGNTVQGSLGTGVLVFESRASFQGDIIQNNAGRGLAVANGSVVLAASVTLQGNGGSGVILLAGGYLTSLNVTSQNNGAFGIRVTQHSTLRSIDSTLTGNAGGVSIESSSEAFFDSITTGNLINANFGPGVGLSDLSFANFTESITITGNNLGNPGGVDVFCGPQFSATRGALTNIGGGTTNCIEP